MKSTLKRISLFREANSLLKAYITRRRYSRVVKIYGNKKLRHNLDYLLESKGFNADWSEKRRGKKLNIFYLGTDENQDKSGFLQALSKFGKVKCFTKSDGTYGQYKDIDNAYTLNAQRLFELFSGLEAIPDILLMQTAAWRIRSQDLKQLKTKYRELKVINISMDDRHAYYHYGKKDMGVYGLLDVIDLALTAAPEAVEWYLKEGVPSVYFPEASSLDFFFPMNVAKKFDVGFVGARYGNREKLIRELNHNGIEVTCYGKGWENGMLALSDTNEFFNSCKVILGSGEIGYCKDLYALKLRDFDAALSGTCYATHANIDLKDLFPADTLVLCSDLDDFVSKIADILQDDARREHMARKSFEWAKEHHTYETRFTSLFATLGVLNGG